MIRRGIVLLAAVAGVRLWAGDPGWVADLDRAANYQLAHPAHDRPESSDPKSWVMGVFYAGLSAYDRAGFDHHRYRPALLAMGQANHWQLGPRLYHADDMCIGQTYEDLYDIYHDPAMIAAVRGRCDDILAHPPEGPMEFVTDGSATQWNWCDSLFMAPAAWVHLAAITGYGDYRDFAIEHWWQTSDFLYDPVARAFYRDSRFLPSTHAGPHIFWARGNGWVVAGLARVLSFLPADDPGRPHLEEQFRDMTTELLHFQGPDGGWTPNLTNGRDRDLGESSEESGTALFCFGMAWGINHGVLAAGDFRGPARHAFAFVRGCEDAQGRLSHVQPIGFAPVGYPANSTAPFGVGAYLLAGSEMLRLR